MAPGPTLLPDITKYNKHSLGAQGQKKTYVNFSNHYTYTPHECPMNTN